MNRLGFLRATAAVVLAPTAARLATLGDAFAAIPTATIRRIRDWRYPEWNVRHYGVSPDATAEENTERLRDAFAAAKARTYFLPAGTYPFGTLTADGTFAIIGAGPEQTVMSLPPPD